MNTNLFAVRHGETQWNVIGKQQGHLNSPLTDTGIKQAQGLAEGLSEKNIDVIYSSDLGRALQTTEIIATTLRLEIHQDPRLRERHLGSMQGLTPKEFAHQFSQDAAQFDSGDPDAALRFNALSLCAATLHHRDGSRAGFLCGKNIVA